LLAYFVALSPFRVTPIPADRNPRKTRQIDADTAGAGGLACGEAGLQQPAQGRLRRSVAVAVGLHASDGADARSTRCSGRAGQVCFSLGYKARRALPQFSTPGIPAFAFRNGSLCASARRQGQKKFKNFAGRYLEQWAVCWSCRLGVRVSPCWNRTWIRASAYPCWRYHFLVVCDRLFTERSRNGGVVGRAYCVCATTREGLRPVILLLSESAESKGRLLRLSSTKRAKFN
jgi:hypothetical protein